MAREPDALSQTRPASGKMLSWIQSSPQRTATHCGARCNDAERVVAVITGLAHTGVCVPDVAAAVAWYRDVLGLSVLSPPFLMEGDAIAADMGELIPQPRLKAAILGFPSDGDRVLELLEYPDVERSPLDRELVDPGLSHVALLCEDLEATRRDLEEKGVQFIVSGIAEVARVRTTWFRDPWGVVFILVEKSRPDRPYFAQFG